MSKHAICIIGWGPLKRLFMYKHDSKSPYSPMTQNTLVRRHDSQATFLPVAVDVSDVNWTPSLTLRSETLVPSMARRDWGRPPVYLLAHSTTAQHGQKFVLTWSHLNCSAHTLFARTTHTHAPMSSIVGEHLLNNDGIIIQCSNDETSCTPLKQTSHISTRCLFERNQTVFEILVFLAADTRGRALHKSCQTIQAAHLRRGHMLATNGT